MLHNENLTYITSPNKIYPIYSLKLKLLRTRFRKTCFLTYRVNIYRECLWVVCINLISCRFTQKIDKLAKKKECEDLGQWRQSISNHMYWCAASTPDGDGE